MQREEDGEYEDREGENINVDVEDPYITTLEYKCEKCGKKQKQSGVDFAPFHCGRPMKLVHRLEHKFDFESITKRAVEKEQKLFPSKPEKAAKKQTKRSNAKKSKTKKKRK